MTTQLNDRNFTKNMLRLAFPIAMQNLLISSLHIIDTAMVVGLGNVSTAAIGVAGRWTFLMNLFYFGFCSGSAAFISQYWGARDMDSIRQTYGFTLLNVLFIALVYTVLAMIIPSPMMGMYTGEAAVVEAGSLYIRIAALGALAMAYVNLTGATLRATEQVWLPFITSGTSVVLNTFLNYCLIYGNFGFSAMGLEGAAWATTIALWFHAVLLTVLSRMRGSHILGPVRQMTKWTKAFVLRFYHIVLPVVANEVLWAAGTNIYSMVLARQGSENYAAYTVFSSVEQLAFVFFIGVCSACAIMVGKAIGAGEPELGWSWAKRFLLIVPGMSLVCGVLLILVRQPIVGLLDIETAYTRDMTATLLLIYGLWMVMRMIPYIAIVGIFRAGGDTRTGFIIDIINVFLLGVPVTCLLAFVFHVPFHYLVLGMYVAEDSIKCVMCLWHFKSRKWIRRLASAPMDPPTGIQIIGEEL